MGHGSKQSFSGKSVPKFNLGTSLQPIRTTRQFGHFLWLLCLLWRRRDLDDFRVVTFLSSPNGVVRFDNIDIAVDDPSLTLYTYNNANELVRMTEDARLGICMVGGMWGQRRTEDPHPTPLPGGEGVRDCSRG